MALTLNNFVGAETGGMEETTAFSGSSVSTTQKHTGAYSYLLPDTGDEFTVGAFDHVADAGDDYVVGFWVYITDATPATAGGSLCQIFSSGTVKLQLVIKGDGSGDLELYGDGLNLLDTISNPFTDGTWHFVETYFQDGTSSDIEVFIDGVSKSAGVWSTGVNAFTHVDFKGSFQPGPVYIDDVYIMSGATSASDRLGGCEVISYRSDEASTTADWIKGSNGDLNSGTWANAQEIVFNESNIALYSDTTARAGGIDTDDVGGSAGTGGPNTDTNIDGTIVGMKGIWRMKRTGGSGATHFGLLGNTGTAIADSDRTADFDPTTAYVNYIDVREDNLPLDTEYLRIGFEKDNKGQDFDCSDMLAQILHVPDTAGPVTVNVTGVAATGSPGSTTVTGDSNLTLSGVSATASPGAVTVAISVPVDVDISGVEATASPGSVVTTGDANVYPTGVVSTGSPGSVTVIAQSGVDVPVTGVEATGSPGTVTVTAVGNVDVDITGVAATGSPGTVTVEGDANTSITGVAATTSPGSVTLIGDANVYPTGVTATGYVGALSVSLPKVVTITGLATTASPGSLSITGDANVYPTGVAATASPGTVTVVAQGAVDVPLTGVSASASPGAIAVVADANISIDGVAATGSVGTLSIGIGTSVSLTGLAATASPGSITLTGDANVALTGVAASASPGAVTILTEGAVSVPVTGVTATGYVGALTVTADGLVSLTGAAATASPGAITLTGDANLSLTGVETNASPGSVTVEGDANVALTGVSATANPGQVTVVTDGSVVVPINGVAAVASVGSVTVSADEVPDLVGGAFDDEYAQEKILSQAEQEDELILAVIQEYMKAA